ncbi:hypothetical protein [Embleya sp. AB8]|uniref:hypothetical protein n=1 Tax=Embleya sp. AB8 TaxID=3156304 RepID=UPI003C7572AF
MNEQDGVTPIRTQQPGRPGTPVAVMFDPRAAEELYELCPPGYRNHEVLRRYPLLLVRLARHHLQAELAELRQEYSDLRRELSEHLPVHAIPQALAVYRAEAAEIHRAFDRVAVLERALYAAGPPRTPAVEPEQDRPTPPTR